MVEVNFSLIFYSLMYYTFITYLNNIQETALSSHVHELLGQPSYSYTIFSHYNIDWIANTEIGLDPNNSVIKRLWCMC